MKYTKHELMLIAKEISQSERTSGTAIVNDKLVEIVGDVCVQAAEQQEELHDLRQIAHAARLAYEYKDANAYAKKFYFDNLWEVVSSYAEADHDRE